MPDALNALLGPAPQPMQPEEMPMPSAKELRGWQMQRAPRPYYQNIIQDLVYRPFPLPVKPELIPPAADTKVREPMKPPEVEYAPGMYDPRKDIRYWMHQRDFT